MGAGASKAIAAAGKTKEVTLVSFNGDPPALDQVLAGTMHATIAQDPYGQGTSAVDAASALLKCQAPTFTKADKKTIEVPVSVITKDNAQARKDDIATKTGSR
jgi:ABC-type sugar transport system substrate-binding protein